MSEVNEQPKKKRRKWIILAVVFVLLIAAGIAVWRGLANGGTGGKEETTPVIANGEEAVAEQTKPTAAETNDAAQTDTAWIAAYKSYLLDQVKQNEDPDNEEAYPGRQFSLICFNDDDIPELVVSDGEYHAAGASLVIMQNGTLQTYSHLGSYGGFQYKEKEGVIVEGYDGSGVSSRRVWKWAQGDLKCVWSGTEAHGERMREDGKPEYSLYDPQVVTEFRMTLDESERDKVDATERKVSEAEFKKEYEANVPNGLSDTEIDSALSPRLTQENVEAYFAALADRDAIPKIRAYSEITLTGTISETQKDYYTGQEYREIVPDKPVVVQFESDDFPALLSSVYYGGSGEDLKESGGRVTVTRMPYEDAEGRVWM